MARNIGIVLKDTFTLFLPLLIVELVFFLFNNLYDSKNWFIADLTAN